MLASSTTTPTSTSASPSPNSSHQQQSSTHLRHKLSQYQHNLGPTIVNTSHIPIDDIDLYMPSSYEFSPNPSNSYPYGLTDPQENLSMWSTGREDNSGGVAGSMGSYIRQGQNHERHPSTSSIASTSSAVTNPYSLQQGPRGSIQFGKSSNIPLSNRQRNQSSRSHLPTPTQTPTRPTFLPQQSSGFPADLSQVLQASSMLQRQSGYAQAGEDEVPQMSHPQRQSFSSMGQAPATPMTAVGDRHDDGQQLLNNETMTPPIIPKFNRTVTDAYQDNLYFAPQPSQQSQQISNTSYLMPANGMITERLHEAQMARSQSSGSNRSAPMSPFRYGREAEQPEMKYQLSPQSDSGPKTISPRDAVLDYQPTTNDYPLFPQQSNGELSNSYAAVSPAETKSQQYTDASNVNLNNNGQNWNASLQQYGSAAPAQSYTSFATPALPQAMIVGNASGFVGTGMTQPIRNSRRQAERTPEFNPAQLTRMESSASEAPQSSQASSAQVALSPKPESSAADSGTYSCTYHGCIQRFTTPQKLQKHKRDTHRNNPNVTPGIGSGMSTAELMERNSQTGPHICGRPNPQTGKPCDAVFSRPYDLTRHEDTIHNNRKQKVRCAICVEDKTFSRSDALTRHMRVVHPEVDFPGKHRKRGSRDE